MERKRGKFLTKPEDEIEFPASRKPNPDHIRSRKQRLQARIFYDVTPAKYEEEEEEESDEYFREEEE